MSCFTIEQQKFDDTGSCECCGEVTRVAMARVRLHGELYATYAVHWTGGKVRDHGAHFYMVLGGWGESVNSAEGVSVALQYRADKGGFRVIDAAGTMLADEPRVGRPLQRDEVVGTPLAEKVFELVDAIWLLDENIAEVVDASGEQGEESDEEGDDGAWPFDQPRNCGVFTMRQVMDGKEPILLVTHDADDHGWQFIGKTDANVKDAMLVCLEEIVRLDPSVLEVADLPPGWQAWRKGPGAKWERRERPADEEED